ncbi:MAG TPA: two-component regulator propeller domain-containing protein [Candidatus Kapabacteria bacterium]|nr:two-component regulator propeller domain-containing protein [Candidatus Kapabacteria bacterium]
MIRSGFVVAVLLAACACLAYGQERFRVEHLTPEQGLSQSYVYNIMQDRPGFIWICTRDGLNRYDGYQFTIFRHDPTLSTSLSDIGAGPCVSDSQGNIWVWSLMLNRVDRRGGPVQKYPWPTDPRFVMQDRMLRTMLCDRSGRIWIASEGGLVLFDTVRHAYSLFSLAVQAEQWGVERTVHAMYEDGSGRIWALHSGDSIYQCDAATLSARGYRIWRKQHNAACVLCEDEQGRLVIGTTSEWGNPEQIIRFDPATHLVEELPAISPSRAWALHNEIRPYCIDASGYLWLSISAGEGSEASAGLYAIPFDTLLHSRGIRERLHQWQVIPHVHVLSLLVDRSGVVWGGTTDGLFRVTAVGERFQTYRAGTPGGLSCPRVRAVVLDPGNRLWVGTDYGLNIFDERRHAFHVCIRPMAGCSHDEATVNVVYMDRDSSVIIGTNGRLFRSRSWCSPAPRFALFPGSEPNARNDVPIATRSILRDRDGMLWVGTRERGLYLYDRRNRLMRHFMNVPGDAASLPAGVVWAIHQDRAGSIWFGTVSGICRWDPERAAFRRYCIGGNPGLVGCSDNACAISEDNNGDLWIALHGAGVARYNHAADSFESFNTGNGMAANSVYAALPDNTGKLWVSSNQGLMLFDPRQRTCRTYTTGDGIQGNEFSFSAYYASPDGELMFGGANGVTRFRPERIRDNNVAPTVAVTAFRVFDSVRATGLGDGDTVTVNYSESYLTFDFAALDYANSPSNRYAYMLDGFGDTWINCGSRHSLSFSGLDPGTYRLRIAGTNNDGLWAAHPLTLVIRVVPPFWMAWWFRVLGALALAAAGIAALRLHLKRVRLKERLERRQVESELQTLRLQMNPHFIFNALSSIQHLVIRNDGRRAMQYLTLFARLVRAILESSRQTFVPIADEMENLRNYLTLEALRFDERFAYHILIDPAIDQEHTCIPTMLLQPLVENAIKHGLLNRADGGTVSITLRACGGTLHCAIEDDGVGRRHASRLREHAATKRTSLGLSVTRERLDMLRALTHHNLSMRVIDLHNEHGVPAGTRVELELPMEEVCREPAERRD